MKWWGPLSTASHLGKRSMLRVSQPTLEEEKITKGVLILKRIKSQGFFLYIYILKCFKNIQNQLKAQLRDSKGRGACCVPSIWINQRMWCISAPDSFLGYFKFSLISHVFSCKNRRSQKVGNNSETTFWRTPFHIILEDNHEALWMKAPINVSSDNSADVNKQRLDGLSEILRLSTAYDIKIMAL